MTSVRKRIVFVVVLLALTTSACGLGGAQPTGTPPAVQLMPDLPGYKVVEGVAVQDYIKTLADGAALLAGNPGLLFLIEKVDGAIECYQDAGAVSMRIFSDEDFALSSGAIAITDRNRLTDPQTLFRCIGGSVLPFAAEESVGPCAHNYTLQRDDNEFYIIYVGTTPEICQTFCAALEGCAGP
jgi:hypothetical protein